MFKMPRKLVSEEQLISIINDALAASDVLHEACRGCRIRGVYRFAKPTAGGCNWEPHSHGGPPECDDVVAIVVEPLRLEYNLTD